MSHSNFQAHPVACFAPGMSDEKMDAYQKMIRDLDPADVELRAALTQLLECVRVWWRLPDRPMAHDVRRLRVWHRGRVVSVAVPELASGDRKKLAHALPLPFELTAIHRFLDETFADRSAWDKELVDGAYHLLWLATELSLGREPLTIQVLGEEPTNGS
jgi:hypothetical protein